MHGYIYKITNKINGKVYIGQTTRTVEKRFQEHLKASTANAVKHLPLYRAINLCGKENFEAIVLDEADSQEDLNDKEIYWIAFYDSMHQGYNILSGGQGTNVMSLAELRLAHDKKMGTPEVRMKISKAMSELRQTIGFSKEHKDNIKIARQKRAEARSALGLSFYDHPEHFASRSAAVYCILDTGEQFEFKSILDAGLWWYKNFKPFGEVYSTATYQRKIKASIASKPITFGNKVHKCYVEITNIKWYKKEGDIVE